MVTVITKTIGPTGRDYATFALAEAATSTIGTSADLVANDEAIVFEADDTTFTSASTLYIANTSLTVDATRNVSYTAASGRPVYEYTGVGVGIAFYDPYTRWSGIDVLAPSASKTIQVRANSGYGAAQAGTVIENATITAASVAVACEKYATGHALGTSSEPITLRNLVTKARVAVSQFISGTGHTTGAHCLVVNCTHLGGSSPNQVWNWALVGGMPDASFKIINCANLAQDTSNDANITGGGVDVSGSTNNIGNAAAPTSGFRFENIGGGIGTQYTPTTSFSTPLGAGDYSVFMGSNGSLANVTGNDAWQQGVGPGTNSDVPTTDINGVARSGATANPGAFEADGFVAPSVTTQTIGPVGRDYATFTLAEASLPAEDITFTNRAFVFEADAATYSESVIFNSSLTCDPTRNVTFQSAAGGQAIVASGVSGNVIQVTNAAFTTLRSLKIASTGTSAATRGIEVFPSSGRTCEGCLFDSLTIENPTNINFSAIELQLESSAAAGGVGSATNPTVIQNCVGLGAGNGLGIVGGKTDEIHVKVVNCTFAGSSYSAFSLQTANDVTIDAVNNISLGHQWDWRAVFTTGTVTATGSNNFGGGANPFPVAIQGSPYPITASTAYDPGAGDFALYVGKNGALLDSPHNDVINGGVGPASSSDVPTTDILGNTRSGTTTNPGAFALAQATAVLTRTIGPVGRDYATFTAAEADVENIGGSADLVFENARIEFEADAGIYDESVSFVSSLTTDATRQVTYKPAAGSEHGGSVLAGVRFVRDGTGENGPVVYDEFTVLDGLVAREELLAQNRSCFQINGQNVTLRNCLSRNGDGVTATGGAGVTMAGNHDGARVENCVAIGAYQGFKSLASASLGTITSTVVNCTHAPPTNNVFGYFAPSSGTTLNLTLINNLNIGTAPSTGDYRTAGSGTVNASGSNNFGVSTGANPFPVAIQGSPYPITPTTDYLAQGTDLAIYDADTGQLYDLESNAVWQAGAGTSTAGVPKLDILGVVRATGTANPGAFEAAAVIAAAVSSTFGNNVGLHANQLEVQAPWIWLYELQTNDDPPQRYRLTSFTKSVEFGLNATGQPLVYSPAPITHGAVEEGTDGSLPTISVTLGNAGPIIGAAMDAADGFVGLPVRIMLVSSLDIASGTPAVLQEGEIVSASTKTEAVVFQISAFNLYQLQFPPFIHSRRRCRWIFGSAECGYNTGIASAGFATCNKTQANCEERGDDEVAQGFARQHPARFGAFPGIPRAGQ